MKKIIQFIILITCCVAFSAACSGEKTQQTSDNPSFMEQGAFSADSAYAYIVRQITFGPRVPGTPPHEECAAWLVEQMEKFGADTVFVTGTDVTTWDGTRLPTRNILARFNADNPARILLAAHYDTRPWADQDPEPQAHSSSFDGANDGASGVGVLLEIARNLGLQHPVIGVDILFTDVEDYGAPEGIDVPDDTWCLGSQQFAEALPYTAATMPRYGILLDMVGGRGARFPREYFSTQIAPTATARVWDMAERLGLRERFPMKIGGAINDDHIQLSKRGIPTTDIIESANPETGSFPPTWHTRADNLQNIDPATLSDVGKVVLNVIYNEK